MARAIDPDRPVLLCHQIAVYAGTFRVEGASLSVTIGRAGGQATLALGDAAPERLVHTGGHRFRSADGFITFQVAGDRATSLTYVRDQGGVRQAVRGGD